MNGSIKYRELHISIRDGMTLIVDVSSKSDIDLVLAELAESEWLVSSKASTKVASNFESAADSEETDSPERRMEIRLDLDEGSLRTKNILAFKDGQPQILRPSAFNSVSDATLILIFALEAGLKRYPISFDEFRSIFDAQNIKSGSPLRMLVNNLKNSGYLDKPQYTQHRIIRLSAKGEKRAGEVLHQMYR